MAIYAVEMIYVPIRGPRMILHISKGSQDDVCLSFGKKDRDAFLVNKEDIVQALGLLGVINGKSSD